MNPNLEKLLSQVYELEGLLLVLERRQGDAPEFIYEMVQKKAARISELAPSIAPQTPVFTPPSFDDTPSSEKTEEDEDTEPTAIDTVADDEEYAVEDDAIVEDDDITVEDSDTDEIKEPEDTAEDDMIEDEPEPIKETEPEDDIIDDDGDFLEPIKLDEALQRSLSKDLSKAFSLNDRFRYRRELFSNSEMEMRNTLNMVEAMQSFTEAEDYFYGDLEWDKESPEVMDFMTIIRNHFL